MKKVTFRKRLIPEKKTKALAIYSNTEDKESKTSVRKFFSYQVNKSSEVCPEAQAPEINVVKSFDSNTKTERFQFQVKGKFHITQHRVVHEVSFHHRLYIHIAWKTKDFSPKKSAVLTE